MIEVLILGIVVLAVCIGLSYWVGVYNFFKTTKEAIHTQWSNLITEYERRVDVFLNLAKTVKSFKKHEKDTLVELTKARSMIRTPSTQKKSLKKIDSLISGLNINVEAYPELKSNEQHNMLMEEIKVSEDRINGARTGYNTVVREFNSMIVAFPSLFVARFHNINKVKYYETERQNVDGNSPELDL